jgi:hypothetical protein
MAEERTQLKVGQRVKCRVEMRVKYGNGGINTQGLLSERRLEKGQNQSAQ